MQGFDVEQMRSAVKAGRVEWQRHALQRMLEREISREDVRNVLLAGDRIEDYPRDYPTPSGLFLGWHRERAIHVVAAFDAIRGMVYVITAYEPNTEDFGNDFRARRLR